MKGLLRLADFGLPIADFGFRISDFLFRNDGKMESWNIGMME
jgi:hypothetical protein